MRVLYVHPGEPKRLAKNIANETNVKLMAAQQRIDEEHQRLESYGIYGMPKLVDVLPDLIFADEHPSIRGSVEKRFGTASNVPHLYERFYTTKGR